MIRDSKQLQIGKAGEYLVCADLIIKGFVAFPSEQGLPYDVLLDTGERLMKVQVKTTETYRKIPQRNKDSFAYIFQIKRAGSKGQVIYSEEEIDLFALVCLDTMKVGYLWNKDMPQTINIRVDEFRGTYHDEKGIKDFAIVRELHSKGIRECDIVRQTNITQRLVNKYKSPDYIPFKTKAKYFSDLVRKKEWFLRR